MVLATVLLPEMELTIDVTSMRRGNGLRKILPFSHRKQGAHFPSGHVELRLLNQCLASASFEALQDTPPFSMSKGTFFLRKKSSTASAVRVS